MVKKIRLLGMVIDNFTLCEEIQLSEDFYNRKELNIIRTISAGLLGMAAASQYVRIGIGLADLIIIGDKEILTQAGIYSAKRLKEAAGRGFMRECLKRMCQAKRRIFLVAQNAEDLGQLSDFIKTAYETMRIVGSYVLEECGSEYDTVMNEINAAAPDAVLSVLGSPKEDEFLLRAKARLSAKLWYSLGGTYCCGQQGKPPFMLWLRQLIDRRQLKKAIQQYEERNESFW